MNVCAVRRRLLAALVSVFLAGLVLACGGMGGVVATRGPRWACPSPTPLPWGPGGLVKERRALPTTTPGVQDYEDVYYAEWEQEYPSPGGPPFPSPTPYAIVGTSYTFGQRVEVWPFHVMVSAAAGPIVERPAVPPNMQRLFSVRITWYNHAAESLPVDYSAQVRLRAVTQPNGSIITDSVWGMTTAALELSGMGEPPDTIPPGESTVVIPIIGPIGAPKTVEIAFFGNPAAIPPFPTATTLPPTPIAILAPMPTPTLTPTPGDLRAVERNLLVVQWTDTTIRVGPPCSDPGALTDWANGRSVAWGHEVPALPIPAPPGAGRLVQIALNQVGKPYVWGAKGPETFDCSGLATWSYAQIGIAIPHGTAGQWPLMKPISQGELRPGDLIFFDMSGAGDIDHVGMLVGDLNGDSTWDIVHASAPCCGVRVEYSVFESAFWRPHIRGFRTAR